MGRSNVGFHPLEMIFLEISPAVTISGMLVEKHSKFRLVQIVVSAEGTTSSRPEQQGRVFAVTTKNDNATISYTLSK
ncbi:hypothetical protein PIB30_068667, partial [Stylosanthes scabra]|nr:hypothetical protein [Stylosanthes scabra]